MIFPNVLMVSPDVLNTHYTGWLYCYQSNLQEQQEGVHPGYTSWLSTHCGLSQNLSLPCNTQVLHDICQQIIYTSFKQTVHPSNSQGRCLLLDTCLLIFCSLVSAFVCTFLCLFEKSAEKASI